MSHIHKVMSRGVHNIADTPSLPYTQGADLSVQVVGWIKPSLPLLHRPPRVAILCVDGHQTWCYISPLDCSGLLTGYDYGPKLIISHGLVIRWCYHMYDIDSFLG